MSVACRAPMQSVVIAAVIAIFCALGSAYGDSSARASESSTVLSAESVATIINGQDNSEGDCLRNDRITVGRNTYLPCGRMRGLVRFNRGNIPAGSTVTRATLQLYSYVWDRDPLDIVLHRSTNDAPLTNWDLWERERLANPPAALAQAPSGSADWVRWNVRVDTDDWLRGKDARITFLLRSELEDRNESRLRKFLTRECASEDYCRDREPRLVVQYIPPTPTPSPTPIPPLLVTFEAPSGQVEVGGRLTYKITYENTGPDLANLRIVGTLPQHSIVDSVDSQIRISETIGTFEHRVENPLRSGQSKTIQFSVIQIQPSATTSGTPTVLPSMTPLLPTPTAFGPTATVSATTPTTMPTSPPASQTPVVTPSVTPIKPEPQVYGQLQLVPSGAGSRTVQPSHEWPSPRDGDPIVGSIGITGVITDDAKTHVKGVEAQIVYRKPGAKTWLVAQPAAFCDESSAQFKCRAEKVRDRIGGFRLHHYSARIVPPPSPNSVTYEYLMRFRYGASGDWYYAGIGNGSSNDAELSDDAFGRFTVEADAAAPEDDLSLTWLPNAEFNLNPRVREGYSGLKKPEIRVDHGASRFDGRYPGLRVQFGYGQPGSVPNGDDWSWLEAFYDSNDQRKRADTYRVDLTPYLRDRSPGEYLYTFRASIRNSDAVPPSWLYARRVGEAVPEVGVISATWSADTIGMMTVTDGSEFPLFNRKVVSKSTDWMYSNTAGSDLQNLLIFESCFQVFQGERNVTRSMLRGSLWDGDNQSRDTAAICSRAYAGQALTRLFLPLVAPLQGFGSSLSSGSRSHRGSMIR